MHQCSGCGNLYGSCGHRAPTLRRDAASTCRSLASDPSYGAITGAFWGLMLFGGFILWIVDSIPHQDWPAIGIWVGVVAFFIILAVILTAREKRRNGRKRAKVDRGVY